MAQETEIKLRVLDERAFQRSLKKLKAEPVAKVSPRVHEFNVIFDHPEGTLAKRGQLLRIRTETSEPVAKKRSAKSRPAKSGTAKDGAVAWNQRVVLTFKRPTDEDEPASAGRPSGRYKVREELELEVSDAGAISKIFESMGMDGWFRYEKYRTTYRLPKTQHWADGLLIELDETPIGTFVELEGPIEAIDRAAQELGFTRRDYIGKSYLALYVEECRHRGEEPRNMLFAAAKSAAK